MGVPFTRRSMIREVTADGNGTICVEYFTYDDNVASSDSIDFDIEELKYILSEAEAQKAAWDAYTDSDCHEEVYEDTYQHVMKFS